MAAQTNRLKLNYFGAGLPGTIADDSGKYSSLDRITIDRAIATLEANDYHVKSRSVVTPAAPELTLGTTGSLQPGTKYSYTLAFVDANGLETASGAIASVTTPLPYAAPASPGLALATGGTLAPRTWYYAFTTLNMGVTRESTLSTPAVITTFTGQQTVQITTPVTVSGDAIRVWRMGDDAQYWTLIGSCAPGDLYTDTGAIPPDPCAGCDIASQPPQVTRGDYSSSITIKVASVDLPKLNGGYVSWRLYRSILDNRFDVQSLVANVATHTTPGDVTTPLVNSFLDDGVIPTPGQPSVGGALLDPKPYVFDQMYVAPGQPLPNPANYPDRYPLYFNGQLFMSRLIDGTRYVWQRIGGSTITFGEADRPPGREPGGGDVHINTTTGVYTVYNGDTTGWDPVYSGSRGPALLSGNGAPTTGTGTDKDFYLDLSSSPANLYGPKNAGAWPTTPIPLGGGGAGGGSSSGPPVLTSPNGSRFRLIVADDGTLSTEPTDEPGAPAQPTNATVGT